MTPIEIAKRIHELVAEASEWADAVTKLRGEGHPVLMRHGSSLANNIFVLEWAAGHVTDWDADLWRERAAADQRKSVALLLQRLDAAVIELRAFIVLDFVWPTRTPS